MCLACKSVRIGVWMSKFFLCAGREAAKDRDIATAAAAALCVMNGANIVRAHNVPAVHDAVRVADAVAACMQTSELHLHSDGQSLLCSKCNRRH